MNSKPTIDKVIHPSFWIEVQRRKLAEYKLEENFIELNLYVKCKFLSKRQ